MIENSIHGAKKCVECRLLKRFCGRQASQYHQRMGVCLSAIKVCCVDMGFANTVRHSKLSRNTVDMRVVEWKMYSDSILSNESSLLPVFMLKTVTFVHVLNKNHWKSHCSHCRPRPSSEAGVSGPRLCERLCPVQLQPSFLFAGRPRTNTFSRRS